MSGRSRFPDAPASTNQPDAVTLRLGYAGLVPFMLGALLLWLVRPDAHPYVAAALSAYAAVIVSFLGGIHWGLGFRAQPADPSRFIWGVVPSLVAWVAVVMPPYAGLVVHGVMLIVWLLSVVMRSPTLMPAASAAPPLATEVTMAPDGLLRP